MSRKNLKEIFGQSDYELLANRDVKNTCFMCFKKKDPILVTFCKHQLCHLCAINAPKERTSIYCAVCDMSVKIGNFREFLA